MHFWFCLFVVWVWKGSREIVEDTLWWKWSGNCLLVLGYQVYLSIKSYLLFVLSYSGIVFYPDIRYCMRTVLEELPDDWHCEDCESSSKPRLLASCLLGELPGVSKINPPKVRKGGKLRTESRKLPKESRVGSGDWEKMVATGKTKYICVKEAIMLSTGEKKSSSPSNFTCHPRTKIGINKLERTAIRPPVPLNFSSQQDRASGPLRQPKPQRLGNMEICEGQLQQSNKLTGEW